MEAARAGWLPRAELLVSEAKADQRILVYSACFGGAFESRTGSCIALLVLHSFVILLSLFAVEHFPGKGDGMSDN